jgi:hypothetical protein
VPLSRLRPILAPQLLPAPSLQREPQSASASADAPRPVHITIGSVEIRAVPASVPAAPKAAPRNAPRPALSLADYLERRDGSRK